MNKVLLVYEDYADLMSVESTLKKVGFDVIGLSSEYAIAEQVLAFNPDLVIGSGRGGKVSSMGVGKRLKEMARWQGKAVLIFPANFKPSPQELIRIRVDMILEAPVPPLRLVQVVGKILGHDENVLIDRLNKAMHLESLQKPGMETVAGGAKSSADGEPIYVKGSTESTAVGQDDSHLAPDRVQVDSNESILSSEDEKDKNVFRFGDRIAPGVDDEAIENKLEEAFPDVDLKSLERELLGGGTPEVERVETSEPLLSGNLNESESSSSISEALSEEEILKIKAQEDLLKSELGLQQRIAKYSEMVADVKLAPKSTLTRVEARRRQNQMAAEWDAENLNELDKLRREFTKALFKK